MTPRAWSDRSRRTELVPKLVREVWQFSFAGEPVPDLTVTHRMGWAGHEVLILEAGGLREVIDFTELVDALDAEAVEYARALGDQVQAFARRVARHEVDEAIRLSTEVRWGARPELAEVLNELEAAVDRMGA